MKLFRSFIIFFIIPLPIMISHLGWAHFFSKNIFVLLYIIYVIAYAISLFNFVIYLLMNKRLAHYIGFGFIIFNAFKIALFIASVFYLSKKFPFSQYTIAGHFIIVYFVFVLGEVIALYGILNRKR